MTNQEIKALFEKTATFLYDHEWCQGSLAKTKDNQRTDPVHGEACKWCGYGALMACGLTLENHDMAINDYIHLNCASSLAWWNDNAAVCKQDVVNKLLEIAASIKG